MVTFCSFSTVSPTSMLWGLTYLPRSLYFFMVAFWSASFFLASSRSCLVSALFGLRSGSLVRKLEP